MSIASLNGIDLETGESPVLFQECKFPIMDLRRYRRPDEVVQNMPTFIGAWANGMKAPALDAQVIDVDTVTNVADDCRFPIVSTELDSCEWIAPNQKLLGLESEDINWRHLIDKFCSANNIADSSRVGSLLNADGTLVQGNPYVLNIVRFAAAAINQAMGLSFTHSAMLGDEANINQFDGLYNQIDNGWQNSDPACDTTLNVGNVVNWDSLTGGSGAGNASPDAVTIATTVTLWGQSFAVPAGLNLGDFLAWYADSAAANFGRGREVEWEMHAPTGWRMAVLKALSCIKLCNTTNFMSDAVVARYERLIGGKIAELFGYGLTFPILETYHAGANTLRFGPRSIGGYPTYGLIFKNIAEVLRSLYPLGEALYGSGAGRLPGDSEPLLAMTRDQIVNRFESATLHWDFTKSTALCIRMSLMLSAGVLATDRHMWLKLTNVGAQNFRLSPPTDFTVDGNPVDGNLPAAPTLTAPADASSGTDTTPTYTWQAVTGALNYHIQIATDANFTAGVQTHSVTVPTYTPEDALATGTYYWRVRAVDINGTGAWSASRSHTITGG